MMTSDEIFERITSIRIIPVVRADSAEDACLVVDTLYDVGIPIVEITMTVANAPAVIRRVTEKYGSKLLVGAGTVLSEEDAEKCLAAGATFLVSPGLSISVMKYAQERNVLAIPGVLSPTEVMSALALGARVLKVFPCGSVGGPAYIKSLRGPFPGAALIPTGGVSAINAAQYIQAGAVAVGVGGELVNADAVRKGQLEVIRESARNLIEAVQQANTRRAAD